MVFLLFVLIMGGLYLGVFTPTEAGGIGAFGVFVFALARRKLSWQAFKSTLFDTARLQGMLFVIVLGAAILSYFFAVSRLPSELASIIAGLEVSCYIILAVVLFLFVVLGCIMESLSMILLTVPIIFPLIVALGFDPIWYGVIMVRVMEMGMITPPVGINVYVIKGVAKDVPSATIFRGIVPFLIADWCHVVLLVAVPQLSLFLPSLMK